MNGELNEINKRRMKLQIHLLMQSKVSKSLKAINFGFNQINLVVFKKEAKLKKWLQKRKANELVASNSSQFMKENKIFTSSEHLKKQL